MHAAKARAMKAGAGAFDIDDFVSKLITFMGGRRGGAGAGKDRTADDDEDEEEDDDDDDDDEPLDWERIGRRALAKSRRVPVMDFMCVSFLSPPYSTTPPRARARCENVSRALMCCLFGGRRVTGSGRSRSNRKSAWWANARNSRRTRRTSDGHKNCAKKTLRDPRTRRRSM